MKTITQQLSALVIMSLFLIGMVPAAFADDHETADGTSDPAPTAIGSGPTAAGGKAKVVGLKKMPLLQAAGPGSTNLLAQAKNRKALRANYKQAATGLKNIKTAVDYDADAADRAGHAYRWIMHVIDRLIYRADEIAKQVAEQPDFDPEAGEKIREIKKMLNNIREEFVVLGEDDKIDWDEFEALKKRTVPELRVQFNAMQNFWREYANDLGRGQAARLKKYDNFVAAFDGREDVLRRHFRNKGLDEDDKIAELRKIVERLKNALAERGSDFDEAEARSIFNRFVEILNDE